LAGRGVTVGVITTVMRRNVSELAAMAELLVGRVAAWQIQIADTFGCRFDVSEALTPEEFVQVAETIVELRRRWSLTELPVAGSHDVGYFSRRLSNYGVEPQERFHGCPGGLTTVGITSFGGIKACLSLPDRFIEGNLRTRGFRAVWHDPASFRRNRRFRSEQLEPPCRTCDMGDQCRAGCWAMARSSTGSSNGNEHCLRAIDRNKREARTHDGSQ